MPVGLAKELVSNSTGSGNSGGLTALVGTAGVNSGSSNSAGGQNPGSAEMGATQLDTSLNNLFDSLKMRNGPLVHQSKFDLTQKLNEELFIKSIWAGANSSSGGARTENDGENVPPGEGGLGSAEFADLVQQARNAMSNVAQQRSQKDQQQTSG